jgi:hypothetical protein
MAIFTPCLFVWARVPFWLFSCHDLSRPDYMIPTVPVLLARPRGFDRVCLSPVQMCIWRAIVRYYDHCLDASGSIWAESDDSDPPGMKSRKQCSENFFYRFVEPCMIALGQQCTEEVHPWQLRGFQMMRLLYTNLEDRRSLRADSTSWVPVNDDISRSK